MALKKIVSGGQTGVDRAALDAALAHGFACGGFCPAGRLAEDGRIADRYPLTELQRGGYRARTRRNVLDSDGTAILYCGAPEGGTEQTLADCIRHRKPYKLIDAEEIAPARAAELLASFVAAHAIETLNVAGPRASKAPRAYAYAFDVVTRLLRDAAPAAPLIGDP